MKKYPKTKHYWKRLHAAFMGMVYKPDVGLALNLGKDGYEIIRPTVDGRGGMIVRDKEGKVLVMYPARDDTHPIVYRTVNSWEI